MKIIIHNFIVVIVIISATTLTLLVSSFPSTRVTIRNDIVNSNSSNNHNDENFSKFRRVIQPKITSPFNNNHHHHGREREGRKNIKSSLSIGKIMETQKNRKRIHNKTTASTDTSKSALMSFVGANTSARDKDTEINTADSTKDATLIHSNKKESMMTPKLIVVAIPALIILSLAMNGGDVIVSSQNIDTVLLEIEESVENIIDVTVPQDATDLFSITLGESLAGLLGAISTWGVNLGMVRMNNQKMVTDDDNVRMETSSSNTPLEGNRAKIFGMDLNNLWVTDDDYNYNIDQMKDRITFGKDGGKTAAKTEGVDLLFNEAVAESDYFITRAAASPLIGTVGLSGGIGTALTVLLASVPYQAVKFAARVKEQKIKEDLYFDFLLEEDVLIQKKRWPFGNGMSMPMSLGPSSSSTSTSKDKSVDMEKEMEMDYKFDFVELFADVCKWLEYDVLMSDFGGTLMWKNSGVAVIPGLESAAFGCLAALSSQIYADVIYSVSDSMGTAAKRNEVRSRSFEDYIRIYSVKCVSAATLFGVYETVRIPITVLINNLLSGGYDSCLGSDEFDFCLQTYSISNPAVATPEAQFRSFVVAFANLSNRFADISNENVDTAGLIRSLAVQLYSIIAFDLSPM